MTTAAIIQARIGSSRLPAKTLLPLPNGRCVIEEVIARARMIEGVDLVVLAIPPRDRHFFMPVATMGLVDYLCMPDVDEMDVLGRYYEAAKAVKADIIMRITADCPLLNPGVCSAMLKLFNQAGDCDFLSNCWPTRTVAHGWDCEIFTRKMLNRADDEAPNDMREHVTTYLIELAKKKEINFGDWVMEPNLSDLRITLDTTDDYRRIWDIIIHELSANRQQAGSSEDPIRAA